MDSQKFVRMWAEENHNNYDLLSTIRNYGPGAIFDLGAQNAVGFAKNFHMEFYLLEDELKDLAGKGYQFYIENNGLDQLLQKIEKETVENNENMRRLVSLDLTKLSNEELFQEYLKYVKPYGSFMRSYIATQPHYIAKIEEELKKKLASFEDHEEIFSILTGSEVEFVFKNKGDFFQKSFAELIGHEDSVIDKTLLQTPLYEIKTKDRSRKENLIQEKSLSPEVVRLGNILSTVGEKRFGMRFVWMPIIYFFELFLLEWKRRYGVSKNTLKKYDEEELDELILSNKKVSEEKLNIRSKGFAKILANGIITTLEGNEAEEFIKNINRLDEDIVEIKGNVASKGIVKGKVVVLSYTQSFDHAEKIKNMSKGDILVSEMT
ncbi:MAG TPA: hypothetical protein DIC35_01885, partial [Candidatus Moranbacteria bacterium]|nr:hypothetical protein [Candidatus Moranbacteria bacterium]